MTFCIEPAQTYWSFIDDHQRVATSRLPAPEGSTIVGVLRNNLLVKRPVIPVSFDDLKQIHFELFAVRLGHEVPDSCWVGAPTYIGELMLGAELASYCLFVCRPQHTISFAVVAHYCNPQRVAEIFARDIQNLVNPPGA